MEHLSKDNYGLYLLTSIPNLVITKIWNPITATTYSCALKVISVIVSKNYGRVKINIYIHVG